MFLISARRIAAATLLLPLAALAQKKVTDAEVNKITREAILIDMHNDITSETVTGYDIATPNTKGQTDLARMKGVLGGEFFAVYVGANYVEGNHSANRALQMIDTVRHDVVDGHPKDFVLATTAADVYEAKKQGKIAALMGIEGGHAIEDSPRLLRDFYTLGVRYMTLTHFNTNNWADSQGDIDNPKVEHHNGLTPLGKEIVKEMNRLGMMVDISHTADKTFWDALETSTAPNIASHSGCRAVTGYTRNMTDEMIKALAAKGGVVNINFGCEFLSQSYFEGSRELNARLRPQFEAAQKITDSKERDAAIDKLRAEFAGALPPATIDDVVAHIDHVRKVAGIDAIGIGTDFDGVACVPKDLDSYAKFPNLTRKLLEKGYTAEDIKKIYGANMLRVMKAVEDRARAIQAGK
ncbi:membrane dipeptidase [Terriglobus albidus]|uniref:Membrane dipeptidase n=1 Tax=Terriglobus albidus TaxID=1592106 RepID=A0A5B9EE56_9BACT|nr:membrane dipeptidase [Terriglobus albidus]